MKDNLNVKVYDKTVGELVCENGEFIFKYQSEDKEDFISLTMPVRAKHYIHNQLHPIFEMHLPEGYLLSIIKKHFSKIAKTDDFGLLKLISGAIRGRINYEHGDFKHQDSLTLEALLHPKSDQLFDELAAKFALSSALSGVQPKVLAKVQDKATLRIEDYIVKSWGDDYKELALNEYYCMKIVEYANIPVAEFFISDDDKLFIMKRFDIQSNGSVLGFEDMCVLQAKQRDDKYDGTYEQIAKTIKTFVSNKHKKSSLVNFFKIIIINNIIQNGDAHLKKFGLLYDGYDDIKLAPAYDIVCTTIYIKNDIPALYLAGSKKWQKKNTILKFGVEHCNVTKKEADDCYNQFLKSVDKVLLEIKNRLSNDRENDDKKYVLNELLSTLDKLHTRD